MGHSGSLFVCFKPLYLVKIQTKFPCWCNNCSSAIRVLLLEYEHTLVSDYNQHKWWLSQTQNSTPSSLHIETQIYPGDYSKWYISLNIFCIHPSLKMLLNSSKLTCWSPSMSASCWNEDLIRSLLRVTLFTTCTISCNSSSLKLTPILQMLQMKARRVLYFIL